MIIQDSATQRGMDVNPEGRGNVESVIQTMPSHWSEHEEETYTWTVSYDYAINDNLLGLRNDHTSLLLRVCCIYLFSDTATGFQVFFPATITAGAAITGVNLNRTSGHVAQATALQAATAVVANVLFNGRIPVNEGFHVDLQNAIILGLNDCIAVTFDTEGGDGRVVIWGFFK